VAKGELAVSNRVTFILTDILDTVASEWKYCGAVEVVKMD
jgi:hypothetical protein